MEIDRRTHSQNAKALKDIARLACTWSSFQAEQEDFPVTCRLRILLAGSSNLPVIKLVTPRMRIQSHYTPPGPIETRAQDVLEAWRRANRTIRLNPSLLSKTRLLYEFTISARPSAHEAMRAFELISPYAGKSKPKTLPYLDFFDPL